MLDRQRLARNGPASALLLATVFLALSLRPGPAVGSGGYLGALEVAFFEGQFGLVGMLLILAAAGVVGLSLCYEPLVVWPVRELAVVLRWPRRSPGAGAGDPAADP